MRILIIGKNSFLAKNFINKYSKTNKFFYFNLYFSNNYSFFGFYESHLTTFKIASFTGCLWAEVLSSNFIESKLLMNQS